MNVIYSSSPCQRVRPLLDSYVSNELLIETNHEVLRHVGDCADCRKALMELETARAALRRSVRNIDPPAHLRSKIRESLHRPAPVAMARRAPMITWMAAAAALTAVVFGGWMVRNLTSHSDHIAGLLNIGWRDHLECALAGHLPATPPERTVMLAKLQSFSGVLPEVEGELAGYQLRQAHQCIAGGRKYVHIAMQKDGVLLSVSLVRKNPGEQLPAGIHSEVRQGVEVVGFDSGNYLGFVMANQSRSEMRRIATDLSPRIHKVLETL